MISSRRNFLGLLAAGLAAPAIVRATSLMQISALRLDPMTYLYVSAEPMTEDLVGLADGTITNPFARIADAWAAILKRNPPGGATIHLLEGTYETGPAAILRMSPLS